MERAAPLTVRLLDDPLVEYHLKLCFCCCQSGWVQAVELDDGWLAGRCNEMLHSIRQLNCRYHGAGAKTARNRSQRAVNHPDTGNEGKGGDEPGEGLEVLGEGGEGPGEGGEDPLDGVETPDVGVEELPEGEKERLCTARPACSAAGMIAATCSGPESS